MCILIVKPKKRMIPSKEILQECFTRNPDGAGFCYNKNGTIIIKKGFMSFESFYKATKKIPVDSTALIHCRIGTSGGNIPELTHPYPLTNDINSLKKTSITIKPNESNKCFAVGHNGIFHGLQETGAVNDTCMFIANILTPLQEICGDILDDRLDSIINRLVDNSKIAIMDNNGNVKRFGSGWIEDGGIYYSNNSYKKIVYKDFGYNKTKKIYGRDSFMEYVMEEYGSYDDYAQWLTMKETDQWNTLLQLYPDWADYIDDYRNMKYSPTVVRGYVSEEIYLCETYGFRFYGDYKDDYNS